jgi:hypothetical protein
LGEQARQFAAGSFMGWDERVGAEIALIDRLASRRPATAVES